MHNADEDGYTWYAVAQDGTMYAQRNQGDANSLVIASQVGPLRLARAFMDIDVEIVEHETPYRMTHIDLGDEDGK